MSNLSRRPTRSELEKRAYRYVLATGISGAATVVAFVLAVVGATSFGLVFLLALITAGFGYAFRRSVSRR